MVIPALHDAANDAPIPYTPVCGRAAGVPVCLNPAYRRWLPDLTAALRPVLAELAGLPGAPVRVTQVAATYSPGETAYAQAMTISGDPPVLDIPLDTINMVDPADAGNQPVTAAGFAQEQQLLSVHAFLGAGDQAGHAGAAGRAGGPAARRRPAVRRQPQALPCSGWPRGDRPPCRGSPTDRNRRTGRERREDRSTPRPCGWPRCPPPRGTPGSPAHLAALRAGQLTLAQLP